MSASFTSFFSSVELIISQSRAPTSPNQTDTVLFFDSHQKIKKAVKAVTYLFVLFDCFCFPYYGSFLHYRSPSEKCVMNSVELFYNKFKIEIDR